MRRTRTGLERRTTIARQVESRLLDVTTTAGHAPRQLLGIVLGTGAGIGNHDAGAGAATATRETEQGGVAIRTKALPGRCEPAALKARSFT